MFTQWLLDHSCLLLAEVRWRFGTSSVIHNVMTNFQETWKLKFYVIHCGKYKTCIWFHTHNNYKYLKVAKNKNQEVLSNWRLGLNFFNIILVLSSKSFDIFPFNKPNRSGWWTSLAKVWVMETSRHGKKLAEGWMTGTFCHGEIVGVRLTHQAFR